MFLLFLGTISTKIHYFSEASTIKGCSSFKQTRSLPYRGYIFFKTMFLLFLIIISIKIHYLLEASNSIGSSFFHIIQQTCVLLYHRYLFLNTMFLSFLEVTSLEIYYVPPKCECSLREVQRNITWSILSWKWWLFLLSAYWKWRITCFNFGWLPYKGRSQPDESAGKLIDKSIPSEGEHIPPDIADSSGRLHLLYGSQPNLKQVILHFQ